MILIALGANLNSVIGPPPQTLRAALEELGNYGVKVAETSSFYRTAAWPDPSDPPFTNAVARIETSLSPVALLEILHLVEAKFGRTREQVNAPRSLDLDLLDYEGRVEAGPPVLPHPRMIHRSFVLLPLADVAPDWVHPVFGHGLAQLMGNLDLDGIERINSE